MKRILYLLFFFFCFYIIQLAVLTHSDLNSHRRAKANEAIENDNSVIVKIPPTINSKEFSEYLSGNVAKDRYIEISNIMEMPHYEAISKLPLIEGALQFKYFDSTLLEILPAKQTKTSSVFGADPANEITFIIPTENDTNCQHSSIAYMDCYPWTQAQADILENSIIQAKPIILEKFGPPSANGSYIIKHVPRSQYAGQTVTGIIYITDPALPDYESTNLALPVFWHEWGHAHVLPYAYFNPEWNESLSAQTFSHFISWGINYSGNPGSQPINVANYEQYNKSFFDAKAISDSDNNAMYRSTPTLWIKLEKEHPGTIKELYSRSYDSRSNGLPCQNNEAITALNDIIGQNENSRVEGQPFLEWFAKQYSIAQATGKYKFGGRLIQEGEGSIATASLFVNYVRSNNMRLDVRSTSDSGYSGSFTYELFRGDGTMFASDLCRPGDCGTDSTGRSKIDLTQIIKQNWTTTPISQLPESKICARIQLYGVSENFLTPNVSCYYFRGERTDITNMGIIGTVGPENENISGLVTISPLGTQSGIEQSVTVSLGKFATSGQNNSYYNEGGPYRIDFYDQNGSIVSSKTITKDDKDYYFTHLDLDVEPPLLNNLNSSVLVNGSSTFNLSSKKPAGITYYVKKNNGYVLSTKTYELNSLYTPVINSLVSGDSYNLYIENGKGTGAIFSEDWQLFGQTIQAYITKWVANQKNHEIEYKMRIVNLSSSPITDINVQDPIIIPSQYVPSSGQLNGLSVTDLADDGDGYAVVDNKPTWQLLTLPDNSAPENFAILGLKAAY
jgi:hypothetical protein